MEKSFNKLCEDCDIDAVKDFIDSKSKYNKLYQYPINTLHYACKGGNIEVIELVAEMCIQTNDAASIKKLWHHGLQGACKGGHLDIFKLYMNKIPRSCEYTWRGYMVSFMRNAGVSGNLELIDFIISQGGSGGTCNVGYEEVLKGVCEGNHTELIKLMAVKGAKFRQSSDLNKYLVSVCKKGELEMLKFLIIHNWINDWEGALKIACSGGDIAIVEIMMENIDPNSGLIITCKSGNIKYVKLMVEKDVTNWNDGLIAACKGGNIEIVEFMVSKGATNWIKGFHEACRRKHIQACKLMLDYGGIDLDYGLMFKTACGCGVVEIAEYVLLQCKKNEKDIDFTKALDYVCEIRYLVEAKHIEKRIDVVKLLVENGVTFDENNLISVCRDGDIKLVQFILESNTWTVDVLTHVLKRSISWNKYEKRSKEFDGVVMLLLSSGADVGDQYAFFKMTQNFQLYRTYCKYDNINPSVDEQYLELLKVYPPYVLMKASLVNKICTSKLPTELYRLLFMYC